MKKPGANQVDEQQGTDHVVKELRLQGSPVSDGIAIGPPFFLIPIDEDIPEFSIDLSQVDSEIARYRRALFSSREDLSRLKRDLAREGSSEAEKFIESHIQMLEDPLITTHMEEKIKDMMQNTESVFDTVIRAYKTRFSQRTDAFFQQRLVDVTDVSKRILGHLRQAPSAQVNVPMGSVLFSKEVTPSHMATAQPGEIPGVVTDLGGGNSHAALIARSKGIPYVASINFDEVRKKEPKLIIVDGTLGLVILDPSEETLAAYREKQEQALTRYQSFEKESHLPSETIDGFRIKLMANVGHFSDLDIFPDCIEGVGLFRTEYLLLENQTTFPSEADQTVAYKDLIDKVGERPLTVRAFDLGGDKTPLLFTQEEPNPVLGCRGIRFLLQHPEIFRSQTKALIAASEGKKEIHYMLPLVSDVQELQQARELITELPGSEIFKIGSMIEVPSAVTSLDALAKYSDFFSIGTNDLVQYTLGVDRSNPAMNRLYYPAHPSVLRLIRMACLEAKRQNIPISICGEIASDALFTPLLIGLGLTELSCMPRYLPAVKQTIRKWTIREAYALAERLLAMGTQEEISQALEEARRTH